jgi:hypothetical protein
MVAPAGDPRSAATSPSVGLETTGQISPNRGNTRVAYKAAAAALTNGECTIRFVHCQRGARIISPQKGITRKLLNLKSEAICPPNKIVLGVPPPEFRYLKGAKPTMLRLSTYVFLTSDVARVNIVARNRLRSF